MSRRRSIFERAGLILRDAMRSPEPPAQTPPFRTAGPDEAARAYMLSLDTLVDSDSERSVQATVATEEPTDAFDLRLCGPVREVLLMSGFEPPPSGQVPHLDRHDSTTLRSVLGSTRDFKVEGDKLAARNHYAIETEAGRNAWSLVKGGHVRDNSLRYAVLEYVWLDEGQSQSVAGRSFTAPPDRPLRIVTRWRPRENSLCPIGADPNATLRSAESQTPHSSHRKESAMIFEQWLTSIGLDAARCSSEQTAALRTLFASKGKDATAAEALRAYSQAVTPAPATPTQTPATSDAQRSADPATVEAARRLLEETDRQRRSREDAIRSLVAEGDPQEVRQAAEEAVRGGLNLDEARSKVLAAFRSRLTNASHAFAIHPQAPADAARSLAVSQAALCLSAGLDKPEKHFAADVLDEASRSLGEITLSTVLLDAARAADPASWRNTRKIHAGNVDQAMRAAFTTHSVTTMLTQTGNKMLAAGFGIVPQTWREVAATRSVGNFLTYTVFRLTSDMEYEELGTAAPAKHGTMGQESYDIRAKTYAKAATLSRQDIVNDDLGAFDRIRQLLGIGAATKMNKVFWTLWLANKAAGTFWTAARGNLVTGSALGTAGLAAAEKAFLEIPGPNGGLMGLVPDRILVPTALAATARELYVSQEVRNTTATTKYGTANIYRDMFRPVIVPELGTSTYSGYSATTWWLLGNPGVMACAEMAFLNNIQTPTISSAELSVESGQLGIAFLGYHDFGVAMAEYRAGVQANA